MRGEVYVLGPKNGQIYENGNALFQASKMVFSLLDFLFLLITWPYVSSLLCLSRLVIFAVCIEERIHLGIFTRSGMGRLRVWQGFN